MIHKSRAKKKAQEPVVRSRCYRIISCPFRYNASLSRYTAKLTVKFSSETPGLTEVEPRTAAGATREYARHVCKALIFVVPCLMSLQGYWLSS